MLTTANALLNLYSQVLMVPFILGFLHLGFLTTYWLLFDKSCLKRVRRLFEFIPDKALLVLPQALRIYLVIFLKVSENCR